MLLPHLRPLSQVTAVAALFIFGLPGTSPTPAAPRGPTNDTARDDTVIVVELKPSDGKLEALLVEHAAKAKKAKRLPYVELGATWCGPCKALERSMKDSLMVDAFLGTYIIRLDIDDWKKLFLEDQGLVTDGIPAFFPIDSTGNATGPMITGDAWGENIPVNMAPPLKKFFRAQAEAAKKKKS